MVVFVSAKQNFYQLKIFKIVNITTVEPHLTTTSLTTTISTGLWDGRYGEAPLYSYDDSFWETIL